MIETAQAKHGLPAFDLIVCDEAHRTTGVTFAGEDHSNFVKVHDNDKIRGRKRVYMTATPRIYGENARSKAREAEAVLASMDDPELFGDVLFHHGFARAVESDILTDYRVIVLAMDESVVSGAVQKRLADENSELTPRRRDEDRRVLEGPVEGRAEGPRGRRHRPHAPCVGVLPEHQEFQAGQGRVRQGHRRLPRERAGQPRPRRNSSARSGMSTEPYKARARKRWLDWLKEDAGPDMCRILSNARCLTEGVDVPALDAIMFLHPRNSQIDVVQAVGRVMRKAPGKRMGYVILPVGVPAGIRADVALNDNKKYPRGLADPERPCAPMTNDWTP